MHDGALPFSPPNGYSPKRKQVTRLTQQGSKSRPVKKAHAPLPRYDQALLNAKNDKKRVIMFLAHETSFTDEQGEFTCEVCLVDKYDVLVKILGLDMEVWIKKAHIVATEIQK